VTRLAVRRNSLIGIALLLLLAGCARMPTGSERVAMVDDLVMQQEFARAQKLLENLQAEDEAYAELRIRRRALRPLIAQYETNILRRAKTLQENDEWPAALELLEQASAKVPASEPLAAAKDEFFREREERLEKIGRQLDLFEAQHLADKSPLVEKRLAVNPESWRNRWRTFLHNVETERLAQDLVLCGERALKAEDFELAESCFTMVETLTDELDVTPHLALLEERREQARLERERLAAERERQRQAELAARVEQLKSRYQQLIAAGWWVAARDTLQELQERAPDDDQVVLWRQELQQTITSRVDQAIRRGQSLYSRGHLREALVVWREAQELDPDNAELQSHIARVERFINKLNRLETADS